MPRLNPIPRFFAAFKKILSRLQRAENFKIIVLFFFGGNHHHHLAAFHFWKLLNGSHFCHIFFHTFQKLCAKLLVCHLASPETQGNFDFISICQKAVDVAHFDLVVALVGAGTEFDFLNLHLSLVFFGFIALFGLLVFEFAKIHKLAYRRLGSGRYFHQINLLFFRHSYGLTNGHNTELLAGFTDQSHFFGVDFAVDACFAFLSDDKFSCWLLGIGVLFAVAHRLGKTARCVWYIAPLTERAGL